MESNIILNKLSFSYPQSNSPVFANVTLNIPGNSRVLVVGANGTGKSTLFRLIAGKHILPKEQLKIFGHSPYHDFAMSHQISFVDGDFPVLVDLFVWEILKSRPNVDPLRQKELLDIFEIDTQWNMLRVSEGQRRRIDLLLSLHRKDISILLLDEVTTHLDVKVRKQFLQWLIKQNESKNWSILYTTHIFDGLYRSNEFIWPTHILFLAQKKQPVIKKISELKINLAQSSFSPLLTLAEDFIEGRFDPEN